MRLVKRDHFGKNKIWSLKLVTYEEFKKNYMHIAESQSFNIAYRLRKVGLRVCVTG